nr:probable GPI-anchored adhesin-like protein PGA55 isoform X2 [Osmia lignaria]
MNLALHGFLLHVFLSILNLQHGFVLCSAGEPGYLDFDNLPETNFSCQGKVIGGYYADVEAGCQMFHVCTIGQKDEIMDIKFLCLNGTVFDQETRVCERVDEVDCSKSERFYNLNLELYGNNAVTLRLKSYSLHENSEDDVDPSDHLDDRQRTTSARPTTTTTTSTTSKPNKPSTTPSSNSYSHPTGYPQHFQPQPPFPQVHTSQSKSLYDDKNGGYHHQYIFHNGERNNNQQATSYQLFSNQGVSSTTVQTPQVHQIRFSSTPSPQIIRNEPSTVAPLFHTPSSTIQTLLSSNGNSPSLINPIFHSHGIVSTTEQFSIHSNNPRDTSEYRDNGEQSIRPLEAVQSTNKGKVSKLTISPVPTPSEPSRSGQTKSSQSSQQQRISSSFLPTPTTEETTARSFYPTPRSSTKSSESSQSSSEQVTQHIHVLPPVQIPQLKPHQITINLPPPDIQRIVQNPSSLLPSQSRVIVTAKASVSDESGRPLNTTQLVTLPLPTIPASYDDYKEGDESFDPFYRDVPKIRNSRRAYGGVRRGRIVKRSRRSVGQTKNSMVSFVYGGETNRRHDIQTVNAAEKERIKDRVTVEDDNMDFKSIKESLMRFRDILFGEEFTDETLRSIFEDSPSQNKSSNTKAKGKKKESLEDLEPRASKNFKAREYEDDTDEGSENKKNKAKSASKIDTKISDAEEYIDIEDNEESKSDSKNGNIEDPENEKEEQSEVSYDYNDETDEKVESTTTEEPELDIIILDPNEYLRLKSSEQQSTMNPVEEELSTTIVPVLSTSVQSIELKKDSDFLKDPKKPKDQDSTPEINKQPKVNEDDEEKKPEQEVKKEKPKRKSSRIRSGGKVSSRKKETKSESDKPVESSDDKIRNQKVETTTSAADSESEQIDKHIFDEPESQTSKEIDTRAVGNHNTHTKSLQGGKDQGTGKENRKGDINEYETLEKQPNKLEKDQEKVDKHKKEVEDEEESTISTLDEDKPEEDEEKVEESKPNDESETTTEENTSLEKTDYKEESSIEHESVEEELTTIFSSEDVEEGSDEMVKSSHHEKSKKFKDSSREVSLRKKEKKRKNEEEEEAEIESQEYSTVKSEEINSKETSMEYHDSTEASFESTHEINADEEYPESYEDSTPLSELSSEEIPSSREEVAEEPEEEEWASDQEVSTEGVLKFTDELPKEKKEDTSEGKKSSESVDNVGHDYVDDNYEPENYKERDSSDSNSLSNEKMNKETMSDEKSESKTGKPEEDKEEEVKDGLQKDQASEIEDPKESSTEEADLQTTTSTTTTTTSTTTTTTTTTVRPTPPKLFKPISARKSYNYIPPTTTPNPVIIKPRLSLLNPKPAKPPKSYNDLAPKPVIRKFPLLTRKSATTMSTTTIRGEDSTEIPEMTSTEVSSTSTEVSKSEENVLESKLDPVSQPVSEPPKDHAPLKNKNDQDSSPSEQKSPTNLKKEEDEDFTPYPVARLSTMATLLEEILKDTESTTIEAENTTTAKSFTLIDVEITSTTAAPVSSTSTEADHETTTAKSLTKDEASIAPSTKSTYQEVTEASPLPETSTMPETTSTPSEEVESTTMRLLTRKMVGLRRNQGGFNCLEKEMYRFYGDNRDCRLFHYCSPGFTSRQVLDFRFVCEEGTAFDEETQSCRHNVRNKRCPDRQW